MRVKGGLPTPTPNNYYDGAPDVEVVNKTSSAGAAAKKRHAGLPEEEVGADEDDEEDI